ncbi:MAG: hypothetical protein KME64_38000 [Scytonematopsis contorta HA4267-MV1]|jgi:chitinase|nr:hypothetical protein [Scytonematopsis contorta HA4267-MV1]
MGFSNEAKSTPAQSDYGELRYNQYAFLCTHNSFTNKQDSRWFVANQSLSIINQLKAGVRALMLDTYFQTPGSGDLLKVIPEPGVYLLHGINDRGWILGVTYGLPVQRLYQALNNIVDFLNNNPTEIVTVFLEDYTNNIELSQELEKVNGLKELIYDPDNDAQWNIREKNTWPLLSDMVNWNKRLVIFSSKNHDNSKTKIGVAYDRVYTKQNYWSIGQSGDNLSCQSRWDNGEYQGNNTFPAPPLFVFSHFRDFPLIENTKIDNKYNKIINRIDNQCCQAAKQLPNFIAIDFFELPLEVEDNPQKLIAELNIRWKNNQGCPTQ